MCVFTHWVLRKAECCGFVVSNDVYLSIYYKCPYFIHISPIYFSLFVLSHFPLVITRPCWARPGLQYPAGIYCYYIICAFVNRGSLQY